MMMRTILLVCNEGISRERCRAFLERDGLEVVVADGAREALKLISSARPDLLVIEECSPDVTDSAFAERVLTRYWGLPVILRTDAQDRRTGSTDWPVVAVVSRSCGLLRLRRAVALAFMGRIATVCE